MSSATNLKEDTIITDKLFASILLKKFKLAKILVEGGLDVTKTLSSGITPLMAACDAVGDDTKKCKLVLSLIENGSQVNARDKFGRTALHYACISGCSHIINILEASGADRSVRDINGKMPHFYCDNFGHRRITLQKRDSIASMLNVTEYRRWDSMDFLDSLQR